MKNIKEEISFDEFLSIEKKLDIRMGYVLSVERIPKSTKMLKLTVAFGETERTIVTNIGDRVENPENKLKYLQFPFIINIKPSMIMGVLSEGIIMVVENEDKVIEISTDGRFTDGSKLF